MKNGGALIILLLIAIAGIGFVLLNESNNYEARKKPAVKSADTTIYVDTTETTYSEYATSDKPDVENYSSENWSPNAIRISTERVNKWMELGALKIKSDLEKAYITRDVWSAANIDQKVEILQTIIIYQDSKLGKRHVSYDFFDYNSGKKIASWNKFSGFNYDY